jgi:hypothetical protein
VVKPIRAIARRHVLAHRSIAGLEATCMVVHLETTNRQAGIEGGLVLGGVSRPRT